MSSSAGWMAATPALKAAWRGGPSVLAKTGYAAGKAIASARQFEGEFDHVLAYWANYAATGAFVFRKVLSKRIPLSMVVHAGIDLYYNRSFLREKLLDADRIFVVCDFNKNYLRELYPSDWSQIEPKIRIHHPGLNLTELAFHSEPRPAGKLITVGRLIRLKGLDYLLKALRSELDGGVRLTLDIVGDGEEEAALRRMCSELRLEDAVRFRGWMLPSAVRAAVAESTALIHPSIRFGDAVPTVVKEAMALGTPVIASEVGGIPELLDHGRCGVLVPPEDVTALARAITQVLRSPATLEHLSIAGRRFAEQTFDQWKNGRRMVEELAATRCAPIVVPSEAAV